jgi:MFS family permease
MMRGRGSRIGAARKSCRSLTRDVLGIPLFAWIAILLHTFEGFVGYPVDMDSMPFFHQRLSMSTLQAGKFFGLQGVFALVLAVPAGLIIDRMGLKTALLIGWVAAVVARIILALSSTILVIEATFLFGIGLGGGLLALSLHIVNDRMHPGSSKNMAFALLYWSNNFGDWIASLLNPMMIDVGGFNQFQFMFLCTAGVAFIALAITLICLWEPPAIIDMELESEDLDQSARPWWYLFWDECFWRAFVMALVFVWVRTMFKHLNSIVPIYMQNLYGPSVNYSFAIGLNPLGILFLIPLVGVVFRKVENPMPLIITGTLVSALSPLPMLIWRPVDREWPVWLFVGIFTVGEALYSPRVAQLAVSIPPPGNKGLYSALIAFPGVLGTFFSGIQAGYLLDTFCPVSVTANYDYWAFYSCANLWLFVMAVAMITFVALLFTSSFLWQGPAPKKQLLIATEIEMEEQ